MNQAYLLIGGNLGNREENIARALKEIGDRCGQIKKTSAIYETAAWGKTDQPDFLNQVLLIETEKLPGDLLDQLLSVELDMGRFRNEKNGPRIIDMDILFFNDEIIDENTLQIPHPRLAERRFALVPMAEIDGGKIHPVLGRTIDELLADCPDTLPVYKMTHIVHNKE